MKYTFLPVIAIWIIFMGWGFSGNAQDLTYEWGTSMGGSGFDLTRDVTVDNEGNSYIVGYFNDEVDFNPQDPMQPKRLTASMEDVFVYKVNSTGAFEWVKRFRNTAGQGWSIRVDQEKNVYVTGFFTRKTDFNPGESAADTFFLTPAGSSDIFVVKLNGGGDFLWAKSFGAGGSDEAYGLALDDQSNIYVTGHFTFTVNFEDNNTASRLTSLQSNSSYNGFVLKLRSNGDFVWVRGVLGKGSVRGQGVTVDKNGNVYAVGEYFDSISLNPAIKYNQAGVGTVVSKGDYDGYIIKLDSSGNYVWGHSFGGDKQERFTDVAIDKENDFIYGSYQLRSANVDLGVSNQTSSAKGFLDGTVIKFDLDGNTIWARNYGGFYSNTYAASLAVDSRRGNIYITGNYSWQTNFNPGDQSGDTFFIHRPSSSGNDIYVLQLKDNGDFGWAKSFPSGTSNDWGFGIAVDRGGAVYATGYYQNTIDLDGDVGPQDTAFFTSNGSYDFYLVKMSCQDTSFAYIEKVLECNDPIFSIGGTDYTETGVYTLMFINETGCDSIITLDLTFRKMEAPFVRVDGFTLSVTGGPYTTYQWLLEGSPIQGADSDVYIVSQNGNYSVVVTNDEGCIDTSDIYPVNNYTGIKDMQALAQSIHVYPNPASDVIYIRTPIEVKITLSSIIGKTTKEILGAQEVSLHELSSGVYLLQIRDKNDVLIKTERIVKE